MWMFTCDHISSSQVVTGFWLIGHNITTQRNTMCQRQLWHAHWVCSTGGCWRRVLWPSSDVRETAVQFCWQPFCICLFSAPNSRTTQGSWSRRELRSVRSCQKDQNIRLKLYCNHDDRVNESRRVAVYTEWPRAVSLPTRGVSLTTKLCTGCRQAWNTLRQWP